jgi:hypothetical protein
MLALGLALAASAAAQAPAQRSQATPPAPLPPDRQPSKEQVARLLEVMGLRQQMQDQLGNIPAKIREQEDAEAKEMASKLPGGKPLNPAQRAAIDRVMSEYLEKAFSYYSTGGILDDTAAAYQRSLSRSDVDVIVAFYSSLAGRHWRDEQSAISREIDQATAKKMERMQEGCMKPILDQMNEELRSSEMIEKFRSMASPGPAPAQK